MVKFGDVFAEGFKFRHLVALMLAIWTVTFFVFVIPLTMLHAWKVDRRPIVDGYFSEHREISGRKGRINVLATLDFDRPSSEGLVHCHVANVYMGAPNNARSYTTHTELAVHSDSCGEYSQLPLAVPRTPADWEWLFLQGCLGAFLLACYIKFLPRRRFSTHFAYASPGALTQTTSKLTRIKLLLVTVLVSIGLLTVIPIVLSQNQRKSRPAASGSFAVQPAYDSKKHFELTLPGLPNYPLPQSGK